MPLSDLKRTQEGIIRKVGGSGQLRRRLIDMGLTSGVPIRVVRMAPMGDPIEYAVRGYNLSLRKYEAELIQVELEGENDDASNHG
ncbi:MAG: ferrous iron transport protein A [Chloroflexi bacterium]|nr:ferrous iron transport protein A [Chloroflexota bacterium]